MREKAVARLFPGWTGLCMTALGGRAQILMITPGTTCLMKHSSGRWSDNTYSWLDSTICNNVASPRVAQAEVGISACPSTSDVVRNIECGHVVNVGNTDFNTPRKDMAPVNGEDTFHFPRESRPFALFTQTCTMHIYLTFKTTGDDW